VVEGGVRIAFDDCVGLAVHPVRDWVEFQARFGDDLGFWWGWGGGLSFAYLFGKFGEFGGHGVDPENSQCVLMVVG